MSNDSAPKGFIVEEVPSTTPPENLSAVEQEKPVVETVPQMQTSEPPQPPQEPPQPPPPPMPTPVYNEPHKVHPLRALLFLIPAVLLVATIIIVARLSGNNYVVREPEAVPTPTPLEAQATPVPTPTPHPMKVYQNDDMLLKMQIPDDYQVLSEDENEVSIGRDNTELFVVRTDEFTNFDEEDETEEITVGGKSAVSFTLSDEGSVPIKIVQTTDEPRYEFALFLEDPGLEAEFNKILASIIFLVDTSDWETFENTTESYQIRYPPDWELTAPTDKNGNYPARIEISKDASDKEINNLVVHTSSNLTNAALTASEIVSSTRTLSGWSSPPSIKLQKLGGGDAQVIQGELSGKWRVYVVIWYKNTVIQMTWDDKVERGQEQTFENVLASFEFTN